MIAAIRSLNAALIIALSLILIGAFTLQFFFRETPCPLCYLQRLGMIGVACGALLNVTRGLYPSHYGLCLAGALFGGGVAIRQIALHACPQFSTFGEPLFGLSLYTWSFITQVCVVFVVALLLFLQEGAAFGPRVGKLNWWEITAIVLLVLVIAGNVAATFAQCGFGPCEDVT